MKSIIEMTTKEITIFQSMLITVMESMSMSALLEILCSVKLIHLEQNMKSTEIAETISKEIKCPKSKILLPAEELKDQALNLNFSDQKASVR